ncbi:elongation factor 1-beta [Candidatus Woesearchaeota archaeon]|nr:MAG: elongation factor 1-beta [Candidatus Woesearchaeota archaeon]
MCTFYAQTAINTRLSDASIAGKLLLNLSVQNAILKVPIKMASVIITMQIMPESPSTNLEHVFSEAEKIIDSYTNSVEIKKDIQPVAFGLKALIVKFVMDEKKGSTEPLEHQLKSSIKGIESIEVTDVRRAIG